MDVSPGLPAVPSTPPRVEARFEGDVQGPVAIENYGVQIGANSGVVVNYLASSARPIVRRRSEPVASRGRPFDPKLLLDRAAEKGAAAAALRTNRPIELAGRPGAGKTTLLRYLAWGDNPKPAGVFYYRPRSQPAETVDDLLQDVFEEFFETDLPVKLVRTGSSRRYLESLEAFILLDDLALADDEVRWLLDSLPSCAVVLASSRPHLSRADGEPVAVGGLPLDAALSVLERELGHALPAADVPTATELCRALDGFPGDLVDLARAIDADATPGPTLDGAVARLLAGAPASELTRRLAERLGEPERHALSALVALSGASVRPEPVAAIAGLADAQPALDSLVARRFAEEDGPGYRASDAALAVFPDAARVRPVAGGASDAATPAWDLLPWIDRSLAYFSTRAEQLREAPDELRPDLDALQRVLSRGVELERWPTVARLGRAIEATLIRSGRWGAWVQALGWMLSAARAAGDRAAEAYALHQLGSRALCLGDRAAARSSLEAALRIRRALGDADGARATRHNLALLGPTFPWLRWFGAGIALIALLSIGLARSWLPGPPATATPATGAGLPSAVAQVATPTPTGTPSATATTAAAPTATAARSVTRTPTRASTRTRTPTRTATTTRTRTPTPTRSATPSATPTPSPTPKFVIQGIVAQPARVLAPVATDTPAPIQ